MKLIISVFFTLVLGVGTGWIVANIQHSRGGEHFAPNNALNPAVAVPEKEVSEDAEIRVVNGESYNFGKMMLGDTESWIFQVKNTGSKPLELRLGETTCKCTFVSEGVFDKDGKEPTVIAPGDVLDVELKWTPKSKTIDFHQSAELKTNDPARELVVLQVRGRITQTLQVSPDYVALPNVNTSDGATKEILLLCAMEEGDWSVTGLQWSDEKSAGFFNIEIVDITPTQMAVDMDAKSGRVLRLELKPGMPIGAINQTLIIKTDVREGVEVACQIAGNVISDISIVGRGFDPVGQVLQLAPIESKVGGRATLQILVKGENHKDIEFEITHVDPSDIMHVSFGEKSTKEKLTRVPLIVEFREGTPAVSRRGSLNKFAEIHFKTNHPIVKEVKLYVSFIVK